jgi:DNA-binding NtrC family response regulator
VAAGTFRQDLFYRLNVFPLCIPPLKERLEDIPILAEHFRKQIEEQEKGGPQQWEPKALDALQRYEWPGNVRELRNMVHRAFIMTEGDTIQAEILRELLPAAAAEECEPKSKARPAKPKGRPKPVRRPASRTS